MNSCHAERVRDYSSQAESLLGQNYYYMRCTPYSEPLRIFSHPFVHFPFISFIYFPSMLIPCFDSSREYPPRDMRSSEKGSIMKSIEYNRLGLELGMKLDPAVIIFVMKP
eukprot:gene12979-biopygen3525